MRQKALPFGNASWYGTDIFVEKFRHRLDEAGGYLSYQQEGLAHSIPFSKDADPKVLAHISFDSSYAVSSAKADHSIRKMNKTEKAHHALRQKALELIVSDTMFKVYGNSSLNLIPLQITNQKGILPSGPKEPGVVIFGNDHLISFDAE